MKLSRSNKIAIGLLLFVVLAALAAAAFLPIRATNLATNPAAWTTQGCFAPGAVYPTTHFDSRITAHERHGVTLWGSYCGGDAGTGELRSPEFVAPAVLELFVAGYSGNPGLEIFLERQDDKGRVALPSDQSGETWLKVRWSLDRKTRGKLVRLVAIDKATGFRGWVAVSNPREVSLTKFYRAQLKPWIVAMLTYLYEWVLLLLPGLAAAALVATKRPSSSSVLLLIAVIATTATIGFISFWTFFFSHNLGLIFSFVVYLAAIAILGFQWRSQREVVAAAAARIKEPLLYMLAAGLCYICFYFLFIDPFAEGIQWAGDRFFIEIKPGDNVIPLIFADRIYDQKSVIPFCCGDWLSSDRPPLQSGLVLLERPMGGFVTRELAYEELASAAQCLWICAVWTLLTSLGTKRGRIRQVLGFLIFSGFLLYNSLYTWPKLLAAACILFVLSILFEIVLAKRPATNFEAALAAVCLGLALMAHPGSTFSLPVFGLVILRFRHLFTLRQAGLALLIIISFYAPWSAYQKLVDPPGNRLLKVHLAGVTQVDSRTAWQAIRDSYHAHPWSEILHFKWLNIIYIAGDKMWDSYGLNGIKNGRIDHPATEISRDAQRFYMWNAVGLVNFGWIAGLYLLLRRRTNWAVPYSGWVILAALANLVFWSFITFGPYETQTACSSYADILLVSVGLLGFILALPRIFFLVLFTWQLFDFLVVWVWSKPGRMHPPLTIQMPMLITAGVLMLILVWLTVGETLQSEAEETEVNNFAQPLEEGARSEHIITSESAGIA